MTNRHKREIIAGLPGLKDAQAIVIALQMRRFQEINLRAAINAEANQDNPPEKWGIFRNHQEEIEAAQNVVQFDGDAAA